MTANLLLAGSAIGLVLVNAAGANAHDAVADPAPAPPDTPSPVTGATAMPGPMESPDLDGNMIVVIGGRMIIAALEKVAVEQTYDEDAVASYGAGSVGDVLDQIRAENGDEQPSFLVNGRPVTTPDEISGLPAEAVSRIEVLPKGSATKIGGAPGQRAYNVVLRPSVKSATFAASHEEATENGWSNNRGEALFTLIKNQDRLNLTVRGGQSSALFESERNFIARISPTPFAALGNILPASGVEIDPVLSALAGQPVSVLALPAGVSTPSLAALLPGANRTNPSDESQYRSLRGPSRPIDVTLTGNKQLNPWLSLSVNARLNWNKSENWNGLPSARFLVPATNLYTPFSTGVGLALNDPSRPLINRSDSNGQSLTAALNAQRGPWHAALTAKWDRREYAYISQFTGLLGAQSTVAPTINPFAGSLATTIPISRRVSNSANSNAQLLFEIQGPIFPLWAGPINTRGTIGVIRIDYQASDLSGPRALKRNEVLARAGVTLPLTSKEFGFLPQLGESELEFDYGASDLGSFGKLTRRSFGFNWQPSPWLRIAALDSREERAVVPELLAAPLVVSPNVPYFDPLTGQTSDVTLIYGGAANLADEDYRTRSVAVTLSPFKKYSLQLDGEYAVNEVRNQVGALPLPSSAVVAAFPDRFIRDSLGYLTVVDSRSINFARQRSEVLRFGMRFTLPLSRPGAIVKEVGGRRTRTPPMRLAFNLNHTWVLNSSAVIRTGLPEVDLLAGGAIGIGGGQLRHSTRAGLALTRGGTGIRFEYAQRGESRLSTGTLAAPDLIRFAPFQTVDLRAFTELDALFPKVGFPRGTRVTMVIDNLCNARQQVTNLAGVTPQAYLPIRRDPVGRTVMIELRLTL